ncbi:MAG: SMP-30/gluconolactonase/LRE family protein [Phycisphaeraceae bacterium]|nr:SMP-30/gluconolactonase/LRE family protein [Phycisphaeraceae bacterium]
MLSGLSAALAGLALYASVHVRTGVVDEPVAPATTAPAGGAEAEPARDGLDRIIDAKEEAVVIARGHRFTEGPVWVPAAGADKPGFLLYSDIARNTIHRLEAGKAGAEPEVWLSPSGHANGLTLDGEGRVLIAMHDGRIARADARSTGAPLVESLISEFEGKRLNSPNDLVATPEGTIYFTDPPYGLRPPLGAGDRERELDFCGVFRLSPDGTLTLEHRDIPAPNGVALSPDGGRLYVADTGTGRIFAFEVKEDGSLGAPALFATNDTGGRRTFADGLRVDVEGHVYAAGPGGVWVYDAQGKHLGTIPMPNAPTNLCFGGDDGRTLFATTRDSVCSVRVKIAGLPAATRVKR